MPEALKVEYCGEWFDVPAGRAFTIGREGDLVIDENPALEAQLLELTSDAGHWWMANVATERAVKLGDPSGRVVAELRPGGRVPLVVDPTLVVFSVDRTTYDFTIRGDFPYAALATSAELRSNRLDLPRLTHHQRLLLVVLCEPALRGGALTGYPTSAEGAARLGWSLTAFNRKLDNVCDRLDRAGVAGLRGGRGNLATRRRTRLVEFALQSGLVTAADLALLPPE